MKLIVSYEEAQTILEIRHNLLKGEAEIEPPSTAVTVPTKFMFIAEVINLILDGEKLAAIKLIREKTGVGLREAKDFIDILCSTFKL